MCLSHEPIEDRFAIGINPRPAGHDVFHTDTANRSTAPCPLWAGLNAVAVPAVGAGPGGAG